MPGYRAGRIFVREHRIVLVGAKGSRVSYQGGKVVVKGADETAGDVHLLGGAKVDSERLELTAPGDGLSLRVLPGARQRQLELRLSGRGHGALAVAESTFWSVEPRSREYAVGGDFRLRHPYVFAQSGGADLAVTVARGEVSLASVALVPPGDPDNPIQLP